VGPLSRERGPAQLSRVSNTLPTTALMEVDFWPPRSERGCQKLTSHTVLGMSKVKTVQGTVSKRAPPSNSLVWRCVQCTPPVCAAHTHRCVCGTHSPVCVRHTLTGVCARHTGAPPGSALRSGCKGLYPYFRLIDCCITQL